MHTHTHTHAKSKRDGLTQAHMHTHTHAHMQWKIKDGFFSHTTVTVTHNGSFYFSISCELTECLHSKFTVCNFGLPLRASLLINKHAVLFFLCGIITCLSIYPATHVFCIFSHPSNHPSNNGITISVN